MGNDYSLAVLAQIGYNAYGDFVEWKNDAGKPMPTWEDLSGTPQEEAWITAAEAITRAAGV